MTKKYKRKEDAYDSACEWLYEKGYEIIIKNQNPARALGFLTGFHKELQERNTGAKALRSTCGERSGVQIRHTLAWRSTSVGRWRERTR